MAYDVRRWLAVLALIAGVLGLLQLRSAWHCRLLEGHCRPKLDKQTLRSDDWPAWFNATCPLVYNRITYEDMQHSSLKPYLLGQQQLPTCSNCKVDKLWSHFCQFKSMGPVCPQWDQDHLMEALMGRAEEGAEGAREVLQLTPCDLWPYLRGRTLWLVGDSMMQEFMRALQCFMYEFWDLETRTLEEVVADREATEGLLGGWCVLMPEAARICHVRSNMGDHMVTDVAPRFAKLGVRRSDIMVVNFAVWINKAAELEENLNLWADFYRRERQRLPFVIWRDASVQHFDTPTGDYKCDGCPDAQPRPDDKGFRCKPMASMALDAQNRLSTRDPAMQVLVEGGWRNRLQLPVIAQLGIPIIHTWNLSVPMWEYHHGFQEKDDCTHWCHPSPYQLWIAQLHGVLQQERWHLPALLLPEGGGRSVRSRLRAQAIT